MKRLVFVILLGLVSAIGFSWNNDDYVDDVYYDAYSGQNIVSSQPYYNRKAKEIIFIIDEPLDQSPDSMVSPVDTLRLQN